MVNTFCRVLAISLILLGSMGCSTTARFLGGPGDTKIFDDDLPAPTSEEYMENGLALTFTSSIADPGFQQQLGASLVAQAGGDFQSVRDSGKEPVYEIDIREVGYSSDGDPSKLAGAGGAVAGALLGSAVGGRRGAWVGGAAGGVAGLVAFARKQHLWVFQVDVFQQTSLEGQRRLQSEKESKSGSGLVFQDQDFGMVTTSADLAKQESTVAFNLNTNRMQWRRNFMVKVESNSFGFSEDDARLRAQEEIVRQLGPYLFPRNIF